LVHHERHLKNPIAAMAARRMVDCSDVEHWMATAQTLQPATSNR
jgi:hypothetical protein